MFSIYQTDSDAPGDIDHDEEAEEAARNAKDDAYWETVLRYNPDLAEQAVNPSALIADPAFAELASLLRWENPAEYDGPPAPAVPSDLPPGSALKLELIEQRVQGYRWADESRTKKINVPAEQACHPDECSPQARQHFKDLLARVPHVARNGRPLRAGLVNQSFVEQAELFVWECLRCFRAGEDVQEPKVCPYCDGQVLCRDPELEAEQDIARILQLRERKWRRMDRPQSPSETPLRKAA